MEGRAFDRFEFSVDLPEESFYMELAFHYYQMWDNNNGNEGTKVQNPRRLCHVHCKLIYTAAIYIRGQMRECTGKYTEIWQRQK